MTNRTNGQTQGLPGRCRAVLLVFASLAIMTVSAVAQQSRIESVSVASESADMVTLEIVYDYAGNQGAEVFLSAVMAQDGVRSTYYGYRPGPVRRGRHRARVELSASERAPDLFSTNQVEIAMYVGGGAPFLSRKFAFPKTWSRPRAGLSVVPSVATAPQIAGNVGVLLASPQIREIQAVDRSGRPGNLSGGPTGCDVSGAGLGDVSERRVLSDGSIELTYPDGTVRVRGQYKETVTCPNGGTTAISPMHAPPPTPPSAPPDATHAAWVQAELESQLDVIRMLVGFDIPSVEHYLAREGADLSPYRRISRRTQAIDMLVRP